jgi:hypothetical protein
VAASSSFLIVAGVSILFAILEAKSASLVGHSFLQTKDINKERETGGNDAEELNGDNSDDGQRDEPAMKHNKTKTMSKESVKKTLVDDNTEDKTIPKPKISKQTCVETPFELAKYFEW